MRRSGHDGRAHKMSNIVFLANRTDGLTQRLKSLTWSIVFSTHYGAKYWIDWQDRPAQNKQFHSVETATEVFSEAYVAAHRAPDTPAAAEIPFRHVLKAFPQPLKTTPDRFVVRPPSNIKPEHQHELHRFMGKDVFARAFATIEFSDSVTSALRSGLQVECARDAVAIHMRAGDIIYGKHRLSDQFVSKVVSYRVATAIANTYRADGQSVLLFGQDEELGRAIGRSTGAIWAPDLAPGSTPPPLWQAMFELGLMQQCRTIVAGSSGFPEIAALISGALLIDPANILGRSGVINALGTPSGEAVETAASDLQKSFTYWSAVYRILHGPDPDYRLASESIAKAIKLDPDNKFYKLVGAITRYGEGSFAEAERILSEIQADGRRLEKMLLNPRSSIHRYAAHLVNAASDNQPWACLCLALSENTPRLSREVYADVARKRLPISNTMMSRLSSDLRRLE